MITCNCGRMQLIHDGAFHWWDTKTKSRYSMVVCPKCHYKYDRDTGKISYDTLFMGFDAFSNYPKYFLQPLYDGKSLNSVYDGWYNQCTVAIGKETYDVKEAEFGYDTDGNNWFEIKTTDGLTFSNKKVPKPVEDMYPSECMVEIVDAGYSVIKYEYPNQLKTERKYDIPSLSLFVYDRCSITLQCEETPTVFLRRCVKYVREHPLNTDIWSTKDFS